VALMPSQRLTDEHTGDMARHAFATWDPRQSVQFHDT
jgi:hypothetical protein